MADKTNEWTGLRQLLTDLELKGRVVSIDARGCQTDIAETIADAGGRYLLAVKDNPSGLRARLQRDFACLDRTGCRTIPSGKTAAVGARAMPRATGRPCGTLP